MASLERVGQKYRVVWRVAGRGSPRRKSPVYETKREALAAKRQVELEQSAAVPLKDGVLIGWLELCQRFVACSISRSTRYKASVTETAKRLGEKYNWRCPGDVRAEHIAAMPAYSGRVVLAVIRFAAKAGQPVDARAIKASARTAPRQPHGNALPAELVAELVAKSDAWHEADGTLADMIATYGHRAESLVIATAGDYSGPAFRLRVKSGDIISHPLTARHQARLAKLAAGKDAGDPLFVGHLGRPWKTGLEFASWWGHCIARGSAQRAGVLDLRRYAISRMFALGLDARTIADITGHRTVSLLQNVYARSTDERRAKAISAIEAANGDTTVTP